jgi:hypothetical protein
MPVTPTSSLALYLANLRTLIAASATFQAWVGADDAAAAAAHVHLIGLPPPNGEEFTADELSALRPFVIVGFHPRDGVQFSRVADQEYEESARVAFSFEDEVAPENARNYDDAAIDFLNQAGGTLKDMQDLAGTDGYLSVHEFRMEKAPTRADQTAAAGRGDYLVVIFSAAIGP